MLPFLGLFALGAVNHLMSRNQVQTVPVYSLPPALVYQFDQKAADAIFSYDYKDIKTRILNASQLFKSPDMFIQDELDSGTVTRTLSDHISSVAKLTTCQIIPFNGVQITSNCLVDIKMKGDKPSENFDTIKQIIFNESMDSGTSEPLHIISLS